MAATDADELQTLLDGYTWCAVTTDAPDWLVCPIFPHTLGKESAFDEINAECPLTFAPNLLETLKSPSPPSLDYFRSLPNPPVEFVWGLYLVLLEKPGHVPRLYGGSGTRKAGGVQARLEDYYNGQLLPKLVEHYLAKGYTVSHQGLWCWCPMPSEYTTGRVRVRMIALEGTFGYIFGTSPQYEIDTIWGDLWPWSRDTMSWRPLCTHTAFTERPLGTHDMTEDGFKAYNEERLRVAKIKGNERSQQHRAKALAQDLQGYLARTLENKIEWQRKNPERVLEIAASVRARNIASGNHHCSTCDLSLQSAAALQSHYNCKAHKEQVRLAAGGKPKAVSERALYCRDAVANIKASKRHYCGICDKAFGSKAHLTNHFKTAVHLRKVSLAAASV